ncbi:MAG TPA: histidine kinase [Vicinamibacterales bacterium]
MERALASRLWLVIPAASLVPALLDAGQMWVKQALDDAPTTDWGSVIFQGMEWLFLGALTPIAFYLARRFPLDRARWPRALAAHGLGALLLCIAWASLGIALSRSLDHWVAQGRLDQAYFNWLLTSVPWSVFMYFTVLGCVYAFVYFDQAREREVQAALLGAQLADARLGALRMQLHPHFLFNSLNTVSVLVREQNTRAASRMLELLGDMLRRVLRADRPHEITLGEELRFVAQYLAVEQMRFPDRLRVAWSVDDEARAALVPDMLLQPLVENAIRHGAAKRAGATRLEVAARVEHGVLRVSVRDEGDAGEVEAPGAEAGEGVGLSNTRERLRTMYGSAASLTLASTAAGGMEATVELPFRTGAE